MSDSLTQAIKGTLWPYLQVEGFSKLTPRKFVRETNGVFQQLWIDANGAAGKRSTYVVLCANLPFGPVGGYMDPHGFRIEDGRSWSTATRESATRSMQQIVIALKSTELMKLDELSNIETMLGLLESLPGRNWHATYTLLYRKWLKNDAETLAIVRSNREALDL